MINPMDNIDLEKVTKLEKTCGEFYDLVDNTDIENQAKLAEFLDVDLEKLCESEQDVDLNKLLDL